MGVCDEAADEIESMEAELTKLRTESEQLSSAYGLMVAERNALSASLAERDEYHIAYVAEMQDGYLEVISGLKAQLAQQPAWTAPLRLATLSRQW